MSRSPKIQPLRGLEIWDEAWNLWGWEADPSFVIITDDVDRAAAALRVAVPRLHATTFAGTEISDSTVIDGTEETETPHSMWGPELHEKGWRSATRVGAGPP